MRVVGGREAAARHQHVAGVAGQQGPEGCRNDRAVGQVPPGRPRALVVVLDGRPAQADLVVELAGREHVVGGEPDVAVDPAGLPDPDLGAEGDQLRPLVARDSSTRKRAYSRAWRRPAISASVSSAGSVALTTRPPSRRVEGTRVMIVAVIPSTGVTWSEPSRRGRS